MGFKQFLDRLLNHPPQAAVPSKPESLAHFEDPTGYYTVRGEKFDDAYSHWLKTKVLDAAKLHALGVQAILANLDNRSGYVREFCLRALEVLAEPNTFGPVIGRLNDYVPSNRARAMRLVLAWLADLPLPLIVDILPDIESLSGQSRVSHEEIFGALNSRLDSAEGREALVAGLQHHRAKVRRACWLRTSQALTWSAQERIFYAMQSGDPAIARSVERDVFELPDSDLLEWMNKITQVRAMPLRRAILVAMHRRALAHPQTLIGLALWDDSFSIRWLAWHWSKAEPQTLFSLCRDAIQGSGSSRRKRYALEGLVELKSAEALAIVRATLGSESAVLRRFALVAVCAMDKENSAEYVAAAIEDSDFDVVRAAFKQLVVLGLPVPVDVIAATAHKRNSDLAFFELLLTTASLMYVWPALHLASFTSLCMPALQIKLAPKVGVFFSKLQLAEVYLPPTKQQWAAICSWMPIDTLPPGSSLRYVMDIYAKRMST
ncbi:HEAT repeat domain-containing protein [Rhodoferax sp.]|uniref:HEAT repeat domain-containing protein n=1 Tax=Rhodoferax sp. TaxID=50421 RepID=UPI002ACD2D5F|nr:HEAT repeat domain-containing protein [Rhodoferax sp.]MDZ7919597.1 HEAT repeat domain-containing protein [Rhodoferax sp.]